MAVRPWCAKAQFPGLKPFIGGHGPERPCRKGKDKHGRRDDGEEAERAHFGNPAASAAVRMPSMAAMRPLAQSSAST